MFGKSSESFGIRRTVATPKFVDSIPWESMKKYVLGTRYSLSVVFVSENKMKELNKVYRKKNYSTDILSFPIEESTGEIFISTKQSTKLARDFDRNPQNFIQFLFIHGLVHLKGYSHSSTMEGVEKQIRKKFGI